MNALPYPVDRAGSGSSTAYPRDTASHGFQRQLHAFHDPSGPPWIHSSSGAGSSAEADSGRQSQARRGVPSSAVAVTSSTRPGTTGSGTGPRSTTGCWCGVRGSRRTGAGGADTVARRAYTCSPSGLAHRSEYAASSPVSCVTSPEATSTRNTGARPSESAVTSSAVPSGVQVGRPGQRSQPGATRRTSTGAPAPSAAASAVATGASGATPSRYAPGSSGVERS